MLAGEPGIGKTRLAQELASRAELSGARVMWGWCYEHVGAPPYWPYVQPIRTYAEATDTKKLGAQMGFCGPAIAEIVPELRTKLPDLGQPITAEPDQARFRLFDSVSTFLKNLAQSQPLLFVVDDLHWADSSSLLMLEFLVREIAASPVLVLGTYRDVEITASHPMSQTLGNLVREQHFRRVQMDGLTRQEVGEFVEGHKGVNLSDDMLEVIHSRTAGNPLFVNEVAELIDTDQITENRAWANIIPEGVRDAIGSRLNRLSPGCSQVLGTASVMGREFDFSLLRLLHSDVGADGVLAALDEALEAKVIEELPGSVGRYQFGHALIQQSLYGDLSSVRRLRAHASIGEALEQMHGSTLAEHAAELARHFAEAELMLGAEKLVIYSLLAGEQALGAYAYEDAITYFRRGLDARGIIATGTDAASDEESADLLFGLARAQSAAGAGTQLQEAFALLTRAFEYYAQAGNVAKAVASAEYFDYSIGWERHELMNLVGRALDLVEPDSIEAGRLLSRYGGQLGITGGDYVEAQNAFDRALTIARQNGDRALELRTMVDAGSVDIHHLRWNEAISNGLAAIEMALIAGDPRAEVTARYFVQMSQLAIGDLQGSLENAAAMLAPAERLRNNFWLTSALWRNQVGARIAGDWATSRSYGDRCLAMSPTRFALLADRIITECETGDFAQSESYLEKYLSITRGSAREVPMANGYDAMLIPLVSRISGTIDKLDIAEEAAEAILNRPNSNPNGVSRARIGLGLSAVLRDETTSAKYHYDAIEEYKGGLMWWMVSVDRVLGLLCLTMHDFDRGATHFEDALAFCRKAGYRPELAWSCCDYADLL